MTRFLAVFLAALIATPATAARYAGSEGPRPKTRVRGINLADRLNVGASSAASPECVRGISRVGLGVAAASTEYPLLDALNSVMAITDASGQVVREYRYDVYGARVSSTGTGPDVDRGYTGRYHDANGLIEYRDRLYLPREGRWLQADRAGMVDGPNLYGYVRNNPVMHRDPSGHGSLDSISVRIFVALARGDVAGAMYYFSLASGISIEAQQRGVNVIAQVADAYGGGAGIQYPGACGEVARTGFSALYRLSQYLGVGRPYFVKITTKVASVIGFELRAGDPSSTVQVAQNGVHVAVRMGPRIFDAFTGPGGLEVEEYMARLFFTSAVEVVESASFPGLGR